jgi:hypothetical protein
MPPSKRNSGESDSCRAALKLLGSIAETAFLFVCISCEYRLDADAQRERSLAMLHVLSLHQVDLGNVALVGLIAGYVMALAGLWAGAIPGLAAVDIADFGRRYMIADRPSAWLLGLASHLVNSILLVLVFATVIRPNLPVQAPLNGLIWGEILAVFLAGVLVAPMAGLGFLGIKTGGPRYALTSILMHALWGVLVGLLSTS